MASHQKLKLIFSIPLKTFDQHYNLYKLITFHSKVTELNKFVKMETEYPYLVLNLQSQRLMRWTTNDIHQCRGDNFLVCPADSILISTTVLTCETSLYFQKSEARKLCSRQIISHFTPVFIRSHLGWIFILSTSQQANFRYRINGTWITTNKVLQGNGILHNASNCHIVGRNFEVYLGLQGESHFDLQLQGNLILQYLEPLSKQEVRILQHSNNPDVSMLDKIAAEANKLTHRDVETLIQHTLAVNNQYSIWSLIIPSILLILGIPITCFTNPKLYSWIFHKVCLWRKVNKQISKRNPTTDPTDPVDSRNE
jgi:hypothetical protein